MNRLALVFLIVAACKGKGTDKPAATTGSATPTGSAAATQTPTPVAPAPASIDAAAAAAAAIDAAAAPLAITGDGIGPLQRLMWSQQDESATAEIIQSKLGPVLPGIKAEFSVLDVPGDVETEEGYWSVKRGDKEIIQVLRQHAAGSGDDGPAAMIVWTPEIPTVDGTKVGDNVSSVLAKHPALACENQPDGLIAGAVAVSITCHDKDTPGLLYAVDASKGKLRKGAVPPGKLADRKIVGLVANPK